MRDIAMLVEQLNAADDGDGADNDISRIRSALSLANVGRSRSLVNPITLYPFFYGIWPESDKNIIHDFLSGLETSSFWNISTKYCNYNLTDSGEPGQKKYISSTVKLGKSASDPNRVLRNGYSGFPNGASTTHAGADGVPIPSCDLSGTQKGTLDRRVS
ncbi:hypothetical protein DFJ73DRAFT_785177 [Zopfochytrium polystomum]|nr:hypothetical protein DFJ73DRAFT_785177 [Zopfochytrium polystomum]